MNYSISTKRSTDINEESPWLDASRYFRRLYIVTMPFLCPNFSMTASFLVTKKGDSNILKFVINYTYALQENIYRKF